MITQINVNIKIDRNELETAISNALFMESSKNKKKVMEMTCYELCEYIPGIIAAQIIESYEQGELVLFEQWKVVFIGKIELYIVYK